MKSENAHQSSLRFWQAGSLPKGYQMYLDSLDPAFEQKEDLAFVQDLYEEEYGSTDPGPEGDNAETWPFPGYQTRHRLLRQLCQVTPIKPVLPPWWSELCQVLPSNLAATFQSLTPEEFAEGLLTPAHHDQIKRQQWGRSPRLGRILSQALPQKEKHPLFQRFIARGTSHWQKKHMVISVHPWDIITMGSGKGYKTCLHLHHGEWRDGLPATLRDSGLAVCYVVGPSQSRWLVERMEARVLLRLAKSQTHWGVVLDRFYGDGALIQAMKTALLTILAQTGLSLWIPTPYETSTGDLKISTQQGFSVQGLPQHFGFYPLPLLNQPEAEWSINLENDTYNLEIRVVEGTAW
jgi:hypothetical protein